MSASQVIFTQDIRFRVMAEEWQRQDRHFGGVIFGHQLHVSIGQYVQDLGTASCATGSEAG